MKARSAIWVFIVVCTSALVVFGAVRFFGHVSRPGPLLTGYLSQHELTTPHNSALDPETLREVLSIGSMESWVGSGPVTAPGRAFVLSEIQQYLKASILRKLADDPLYRYTHYYRLEIENDSDRTFEDVSVRFPDVEAVEIRRSRWRGETVPPRGDRYHLGSIGPEEQLEVYGWMDRPFYFQEENGVLLRHAEGLAEIILVEPDRPEHSWIRVNLLLVIILGGLLLFLAQKMVFVIRTCSKIVKPEIEKKINIE